MSIFGSKAAQQGMLNQPMVGSIDNNAVMASVYQDDIIRKLEAQARDERRKKDITMEQTGDLIVRQVANGYLVIRVGEQGTPREIHVATDAESLTNVIKQVSVAARVAS